MHGSSPNASPVAQAATFILGLIMGTGSTITIKVIYGLESVNSAGQVAKFEKPQSTTWAMFIGMMIALPVFLLLRRRALNKLPEEQPLLDGGKRAEVEEEYNIKAKTCFMLILPAMFDLIGTALAQLGLMYCTVSVYQLVRCAVMIIVALLKVCVFKETLAKYMWTGLGIMTLAMVMVSATSFFGENADPTGRDPRLGIAFLLLSCTVQGTQYVYEEVMMRDFKAHPLLVVGMEGFWGSLLMPFVVFPFCYFIPGHDVGGRMENIIDSLTMVKNSSAIFWVLVAFIVTVFFYNVFAVYVTNLLSSVWHAILDNFRPVSVWGTDLVLYYCISHGVFGEQWTKWSWLQLAGMFVLFFGTAVFNASIKLPGFHYEQLVSQKGGETLPAPMAHDLTRSPLRMTPTQRKQREALQMSSRHNSPHVSPFTRSSDQRNSGNPKKSTRARSASHDS